MGQAGRCGVDLPEPPKVEGSPGRPAPQAARSACRASPSRRRCATTCGCQPEELRHRPGRLSAGLVHDEAQSAPQREDGAPAGLRRPPSAAAGLDRAGRAGADGRAGALAEDPDRHAGRGAVAEGRRAWRAVRPAGDPRRPRGARASAPAQDACWCRNRRTAPIPATAAVARLHREADPGQRPTAASTSPRWRPSWAPTWRPSC